MGIESRSEIEQGKSNELKSYAQGTISAFAEVNKAYNGCLLVDFGHKEEQTQIFSAPLITHDEKSSILQFLALTEDGFQIIQTPPEVVDVDNLSVASRLWSAIMVHGYERGAYSGYRLNGDSKDLILDYWATSFVIGAQRGLMAGIEVEGLSLRPTQDRDVIQQIVALSLTRAKEVSKIEYS